MKNNEMKKYTLGNMSGMLEQMRRKVDVLDALDRDTTTTGSYDLHDQLTSMSQTLKEFEAVVQRAVLINARSLKVVPSK